ncbi:MAG: TlpA family protein disulfide reductase [bacterium]|nr:TlpA family protein disulfide reductase [bacterium]
MLRNNIAFLLMVFAGNVFAQLHLDDPNYTYQTQSNEVLESSQVEELLTSGQHYSLKEEETVEGNYVVTLVPISNREFRQTIRKKKKLVRDLKGQKMVDYSLKDQFGNQITNHSFDAAKVTVYNFWFTTCDHCVEEIPKLNKVVAKFSSSDVNFIAPTFNTHTQVAKFLEDNTFNYTILTSGKRLAQDLHIRSYPTHLIVDHNGMIQKVMIGSSDRVIKHLYKNIKHLLGHEIRVENRIANH